MTTLDLDAPTRPYIDMLRAELKDYVTKRAEAWNRLHVEQPEYAAKVDQMWQHAIGVQLAKIAREETNAQPTL